MSEPNHDPVLRAGIEEDLEKFRRQVLHEAAEHLRNCARRWDGGDLGRFPILRHRWRDALRTGVGFAAMELDNLAREEDER